MSDLNLLRYYSRLVDLGVGKEIATVLDEVAERLCTSQRHGRNLLNQMQDNQWLTWVPKAGRNQRSALKLNIDLDVLKQQLAAERILNGRYEKALEILDNDEMAFGRLLQNTSGASMREGRLNIQLTYKRPFERLIPHQHHRNSERFLLRQIYCCLVACDENGRILPALAHHWEYDESRLQWTFYLRPGLTFHDGHPINGKSVVDLFRRLSLLPDYQLELEHVEAVSAPQPLKIIFQLREPDPGFAGLIAGIRYSIQPGSQVNTAGYCQVIGSGPFKVVEHSTSKLILQAFDHYYACRSLTDQITIWLFEEDHTELPVQTETKLQPMGRSCEYYVSSANPAASNEHTHQFSRLEEGCMYMLINQTSASTLTLDQRRWITTIISPDKIRQQLLNKQLYLNAEDASHLLPFWYPVARMPITPLPLPQKLSIAVYDYVSLKHVAQAISYLLGQQGVEVSVRHYPYQKLFELAHEHAIKEDLVLTSINLDDNRHSSAYSYLAANSVIHHCIGPNASEWLCQALRQTRVQIQLPEYLSAIEPVVATLINESWLLPLFHEQQTLKFHDLIKNVSLTTWGWPELKHVWSTG